MHALGDASLWYKLAEVNGLAGDESLIEGTTQKLVTHTHGEEPGKLHQLCV
jgi:hypothetical protein